MTINNPVNVKEWKSSHSELVAMPRVIYIKTCLTGFFNVVEFGRLNGGLAEGVSLMPNQQSEGLFGLQLT